jgi:hypothetical protein
VKIFFDSNFVDGNLVSEYQQVKGKWFLKKICHKFTNEYFNSLTAKKDFTITEIFDWYSDSVSHFIKTDLVDKFFTYTPLPLFEQIYSKSQWNKSLPPFHYYKKEEVYKDLEKQSPVEVQFENNGEKPITPSDEK